VKYRLENTSDKSVVFNENVGAVGKATMSDAFYGVERLRIANEYSIKNNIKAFIEELQKRK